MGRAPCCDKASVKRGPWSPDEDALLKTFIQSHGHGGNWISLPQKAGLKRCGKSCRLRWLNYLRPDIKHGGFTQEEDNTIISLYEKLGSRWSIIASHLPGRTDNDVKNYWNTKLKKRFVAATQPAKVSTEEIHAPQNDLCILPISSRALPLPQPRISGIKAEVFSHVDEFSKPLHPNYFIGNLPYSYYSEEQPYSMTSLMKFRQVVSPRSGDVSASSSSVTVDNGSACNSLVNWNSSSDAFFGDFSEFLSGYGEPVMLP